MTLTILTVCAALVTVAALVRDRLAPAIFWCVMTVMLAVASS